MFKQVLEVKNLIDNSNRSFDKRILLQDNESSLNIVGLKKDEIIDKHTSPVSVGIYVISGKIELHFDSEQFLLKKNDLFLFEKDTTHKVLAQEDSLFFVIRI